MHDLIYWTNAFVQSRLKKSAINLIGEKKTKHRKASIEAVEQILKLLSFWMTVYTIN